MLLKKRVLLYYFALVEFFFRVELNLGRKQRKGATPPPFAVVLSAAAADKVGVSGWFWCVGHDSHSD